MRIKTFIIFTLALMLALGNLIFLIPSHNTSAQTAPVIENQVLPNIDENSSNETFVGTVIANDDDPGDILIYSITGGNTGDAFKIDNNDGEIRVNNSNALNRETNPVFNLTVEVEDSGTTPLSDDAVVTINLNDVNESPVVENATLNIDENSPNGETVGTVTSSDPEDNITGFTINPATVFSIDNNGQITVADSSQLDYETTPQYTVTVEATDGGALTDDATITININDINDNPPVITNPEPISFNIAENSPNDTSIGTITATDLENNITDFTITAGNSTGVFAIDATGQITVADSSQLDFETAPQYNLTIVVEDSGNPPLTDTADVTINVTDVNDPPVTYDGTASAAEDGIPVSSQVPTPTDQDSEINPNGYGLVDDLTPEGNLTFNPDGTYTFDPDTGFQDLRQGQTRDDTFTYTASDTGGAISEPATITITITGVNDPPTDITLDNNSVAEHLALGTLVGSFSTTDVDTGDTYTYTLAVGEGDDDNAYFNIDGNELQTGQEFDFETRYTYSIRVKTDDGSASHEEAFTINIINGNDPPTGITLSGNTVAENTASGAFVGTLSATDDPSDTHTFSIIGQEHEGAFIINGNEIRAGNSLLLNYEADTQHMLIIKAMDSGSLAYISTFTINITNVNEPPAASADTWSVIRGGNLNVSAPGVLANDSDPEGATLSGTAVSNPAHDSAFTFNNDGSFSYTNDGTAATTDSFTYKAYDGTLYSNMATVTITITDPVPPTLTSPTATVVTKTSATLGATVTSDGGAAITKRGVVWSTSAAPTLQSCSGSKAATGTTGVFTVPVSGLAAGTKYYYRGFATSNAGKTGYTEDATFETNPELSNVQVAASVNEGSIATLSGNTKAASGTKLTIDWGDGSTTSEENPGTSFSKSHTYADGSRNGTSYTITITLTLDSDTTRKDTVTKSITVKNVAPTASITGSPNPVDEGETFTLTIGSPVDPGADTVTKYTVWWDTMTSNNYNPGAAMTHIYTDVYSSVFIRVYITDEDGDHQISNTLSLKVSNVAPVAKSDKYTTFANSPLHKYASEGLLINDENPADEDISIISVDDSATNGEITWKADGSFTYDPNGAYDWLEEGDTRTDTFAYTIKDDDGSTDEAIVTITVKGYTPSASKTPDPVMYFLHATTSPGEGGSVSMYPAGGLYGKGTTITIVAIPAEGYNFTGWSGDLAGTANPHLVTIDGNMNVIAKFSAAPVGTIPATGTPSAAGTPVQTGTPTEDEDSGGFNPWVVIGPLLGIGGIVALARIERMGGFAKLHKSWTRTKVRGI